MKKICSICIVIVFAAIIAAPALAEDYPVPQIPTTKSEKIQATGFESNYAFRPADKEKAEKILADKGITGNVTFEIFRQEEPGFGGMYTFNFSLILDNGAGKTSSFCFVDKKLPLGIIFRELKKLTNK